MTRFEHRILARSDLLIENRIERYQFGYSKKMRLSAVVSTSVFDFHPHGNSGVKLQKVLVYGVDSTEISVSFF